MDKTIPNPNGEKDKDNTTAKRIITANEKISFGGGAAGNDPPDGNPHSAITSLMRRKKPLEMDPARAEIAQKVDSLKLAQTVKQEGLDAAVKKINGISENGPSLKLGKS